MPGNAVADTHVEPSVDDRFLDLICSDPDLLAAEFDAILAAEWPEPPTERPDRRAAGSHPGSGPTRRGAHPAPVPVSRPRHPGIGGWAPQRAPPVRPPTHDQQEGR